MQIERTFSVKNRNYSHEDSQQNKQKQTRHFPNQVYRQETPENKIPKDVDKVQELMRLTEQIKSELSKVKFCMQCKRKFSSIKYLVQHEQNSEAHGNKKVKV